MAKKVRFVGDASFNFGHNVARPKGGKPKSAGKGGKKAGKGGGS